MPFSGHRVLPSPYSRVKCELRLNRTQLALVAIWDQFKWIWPISLPFILLLQLPFLCHVMKLSSGKRKLPIAAPFPCHRGSVRCHLSHRTHLRHQPNEQPIIIWLTHFNLFTVPYVTLVPLLSSLLLCVGWLSTDAGTSQAGAILNWNYNEFRLPKCAFLPSSTGLSFCLSLCALLCLACRRSTPPDSSKLACHQLLMATLTVIFLLAIVNARPAGAQSPAFLNADSLDSYEQEDEEDNEQTGT